MQLSGIESHLDYTVMVPGDYTSSVPFPSAAVSIIVWIPFIPENFDL